jgi:hypothetical protein
MTVGPHGPHGPHGGLHAITPPRNGPHAYKIPNRNPVGSSSSSSSSSIAGGHSRRRGSASAASGAVPGRGCSHRAVGRGVHIEVHGIPGVRPASLQGRSGTPAGMSSSCKSLSHWMGGGSSSRCLPSSGCSLPGSYKICHGRSRRAVASTKFDGDEARPIGIPLHRKEPICGTMKHVSHFDSGCIGNV